jgi:hypothetical protein
VLHPIDYAHREVGAILNVAKYQPHGSRVRPRLGAPQILGNSVHGVWLGIGKRTSQGYALGERPVPQPVAMLLRLCLKHGFKPEDVE